MTSPKIIVLDDDPTGSQTVHSCLLLLKWDVETLRLGLADQSPIFFVLTNTRAMTPENALATVQEVCHNLKQAMSEAPLRLYLDRCHLHLRDQHRSQRNRNLYHEIATGSRKAVSIQCASFVAACAGRCAR